MAVDDLSKWRDEFPILARTVYMISNSLGAMPRQTARHLADVRRDVGDARRARLGRSLVGDAGRSRQQDRAHHRRAGRHGQHARERDDGAHGGAVVRAAAGARKRIVCSAMDFPSMVHLFRAQQAAGFELHRRARPRTISRCAPSGCSTRSTTRPPSSPSRTCCSGRRTSWTRPRSRGARARWARRPSSTRISPPASFRSTSTALGVDFAVGGCLKWLCGGPGNAFLYTRPDLLKARAVVHRLGVAAASVRVRHRHLDARDDAMHMMNGTPSIPAYYAALAGLDIINAVGVDRIREESKRLTARLLALVDQYGFTSAASRDPERLAGTVAVRRAGRAAGRPHPQGARVHRRLPAAGRRPHLAAFLQHDGRGRSRHGGDRVDRREEGLRGRAAADARHIAV